MKEVDSCNGISRPGLQTRLARSRRRRVLRPVLRFASTMTLAAALICFWMFSIGAQATSQAQATPAAGAREAFLKTIARPRVPLDATARQRQEPGDAIVEDISFAAEAGERVPGLLFKPRGAEGRRPVVVVLHGTGGSKDGMAGRLRELAARGFVAVAIDGRHHGVRTGSGSDGMPAYQSAILRAYRSGRGHPFLFDTVWDVMRLIDYLETREDVDARRIGLTG